MSIHFSCMARRVVFTFTAISLSLCSARADALDNWTSGVFSPDNYLLHGVAYGNGRYVAVGQENAILDYGVIVSSEDGLNWVLRRDGSVDHDTYELHKVTYGNGTFVAVGWDFYGGQNLYHSTNGINWTSHTNATVSNFYGVTCANGLFVAVGDGIAPGAFARTRNSIYTSPDGSTWTQRSSGAPINDPQSLQGVTYGAGRYVAIDDTGYVYTSLTGTTWSRNLVSGNANIHSYGDVSYCNGRFIALVNTGTNFVSADGLSWAVMVKDITNLLSQVIYTNGLYVALSSPLFSGSDTTVLTSTNGTNWIQRNFPTSTSILLRDIAFGNNRVIAVGYTNPGFFSYTARAFVSDPFVAAGINSGFPPQLKISGLQGRTYRIDYLDSLRTGSNNWQPLATFSLTNSPLLWTDPTATNSQRLYRAVLLP